MDADLYSTANTLSPSSGARSNVSTTFTNTRNRPFPRLTGSHAGATTIFHNESVSYVFGEDRFSGQNVFSYRERVFFIVVVLILFVFVSLPLLFWPHYSFSDIEFCSFIPDRRVVRAQTLFSIDKKLRRNNNNDVAEHITYGYETYPSCGRECATIEKVTEARRV